MTAHQYSEEPSKSNKVMKVITVVGIVVTYVLLFVSLLFTYQAVHDVQHSRQERDIAIDHAVCTLLALIPEGESAPVDNLRVTFHCAQFGKIHIPTTPPKTTTTTVTATPTTPKPGAARGTSHHVAPKPGSTARRSHVEAQASPSPHPRPTPPVRAPRPTPVPTHRATPSPSPRPLLPVLGPPLCNIVGICI